MKSIWIFGNVTKDVYLNMSDDSSYERDDKNNDWLNLCFRGDKHFYNDRTSVLGGAAATSEVLQKFGFQVIIADESVKNDYRYILVKDDGIAYFTNESRGKTDYTEPIDASAIVIDRSAGLNDEFVAKILDYKSKNPKIPLVTYLPKIPNEAAKRLAIDSDFVFCESREMPELKQRRKTSVCYVGENYIQIGEIKEKINLNRCDKMTHLTLYSIIAATVIGGMFSKRNIRDTLLLAKANVENARLNETLDINKLLEIVENEQSDKMNLRLMAKFLVSNGKGILAADESGGSIHKKFQGMNIPDDEDHRRDYRNIFFTTEGLRDYINGVILFDETARQRSDDGRVYTEYLIGQGVVPGIKVDMGLTNFANSTEKYTTGLDGLSERLKEYYNMGLRFAKWRAAFEITDTTPSDFAINENCKILAEYARTCQDELIVPIVEPEVVFDGNYNIHKSKEVTSKILKKLFQTLKDYNVDLRATILKVNMVIGGKQFPVQSTADEVGLATAEVLKENVPKDLAGVVFLSGGQTVEQATDNLRAVINHEPFPWPVTFSFARALQEPALVAWAGNNANAQKARDEFRQRLIANCEAIRKK